jgi:hypothetical protein
MFKVLVTRSITLPHSGHRISFPRTRKLADSADIGISQGILEFFLCDKRSDRSKPETSAFD